MYVSGSKRPIFVSWSDNDSSGKLAPINSIPQGTGKGKTVVPGSSERQGKERIGAHQCLLLGLHGRAVRY